MMFSTFGSGDLYCQKRGTMASRQVISLPEAGDQPRVLLWAEPRSVSTALFRAVTAHGKLKPLLEVFSRAYHTGPERVSERYSDDPDTDTSTYGDALDVYHQPYDEYEGVFAKDMAYYLTGRLLDLSFIPEGYTHTFIIRHPAKAVTSLYKMSLDTARTGWTYFEPGETGFEELHQLYYLLSTQTDAPLIVIDADDLLHDPERMLREYCRRVGLRFAPEMLDWESGPVDTKVYEEWLPWFEAALTSPTFQRPPLSVSGGATLQKDRPQALENAIQHCLPFYFDLYEKRMKLQDCVPLQKEEDKEDEALSKDD